VPGRSNRQRRRLGLSSFGPAALIHLVNAEETQTRDDDSPAIDRAVALTIAGSDSSAGAGIQADLKTFSAFGVYGLTAVTCVVAETPGKVLRIAGVDPGIVEDQIAILLSSFPVAAIKTGLLYSSEIIAAVMRTLEQKAAGVPLIVDPVMIATSGDRLLQEDAVDLYKAGLFAQASLITPNLAEAGVLLNRQITNRDQMENAAIALSERFKTSVLLKGGHLTGDEAIDVLRDGGQTRTFSSPFIKGVKTHGTGCAYSAAIAAGLALKVPLEQAVERAKTYVHSAIRDHFTWGEIHALNHSPHP
jgi:hydroxymethylpyrimidine/phosphomethylpyrimidine kinase